MSRQAIQKAVYDALRQSGRSMTVRELVDLVRHQHPELQQVADFDIRAAILAMTAVGAIESTSTGQVRWTTARLPAKRFRASRPLTPL